MTSTQLQIVGQTTILNKSVNVFGTFEEPLFLAKDVAEWIEYSEGNVSHMLQMVDESEKVKIYCAISDSNKFTKPTESATYGFANRLFLTEDGIYEVLMQSTKPIAKTFKKQVKSYLKELRTKGVTATPDKINELLENPDMLIEALQKLKEERHQRQLAESKARVAESKASLYECITKEQAPLFNYARDVLKADNGHTITAIGAQFNISGEGLNKVLEATKIIRRTGKDITLTANYQGKGIAIVSTYPYTGTDGNIKTRKDLRWTEEGSLFISKLLKNAEGHGIVTKKNDRLYFNPNHNKLNITT